MQYNSISDPELCCEACESLKWLPSGDAQDTPCVAFQITHGRCQIVREKHFTDRYGTAGLGRYSGVGNDALSVTQAMEALIYLHTPQPGGKGTIVHRDFKPENILLDEQLSAVTLHATDATAERDALQVRIDALVAQLGTVTTNATDAKAERDALQEEL